MKTVTKLQIPPTFDTTVVELVQQAVARAGLDYWKVSMSDIYPLIKHLRLELKIAYSIGVEQGMTKALATLKKELDIDKAEEKGDE